MRKRKKIVVVSWEIVVVGILSLFNALGFMPEVNWLTTVAPATVGIAILMMYGSNKFTRVLCPFLVICGAFRFAIYAFMPPDNRLPVEVRIPIYIIILGILLLWVNLKRASNSTPGSEQS